MIRDIGHVATGRIKGFYSIGWRILETSSDAENTYKMKLFIGFLKVKGKGFMTKDEQQESS